MDPVTIREGATVYAADGEKIGKVIGYDGQAITVEKGWLFPTDYFVPVSAIGSQQGDDIYLTVTKDEALNSDWTNIPAGDLTTTGAAFADTAGVTASSAYDLNRTDTGYAASGTQATGTIGAGADIAGTDSTATQQGDVLRVPVREEELTATKRPVEMGKVRVEKDVITEERTLDVPVTEERVQVTRRAVDRDISAADTGDAFQEQTIEVPLRTEQVDVQKRVRVGEEVEISKEAVQRTERVSDSVRREEVRVDDDTTGTVSGTK